MSLEKKLIGKDDESTVQIDIPSSASIQRSHENMREKAIKIFVVVALYWTVSITLVFVNKALLNNDSERSFNVPFFITWFQCVVSAIILRILHQCREHVSLLNGFPRLDFEYSECLKVMKLSIVFVSMVTFNNLCLLYVGISFYYVGRSLTTVFNVLCSYFILNIKTSIPSMICCVVIISGFLLGIDQENALGSFSLAGSIFGVLASLFVSLNAIFTKKMLPHVDHNIWKLIYYNNINAIFLFLPLMFVSGEPFIILSSHIPSTIIFWRNMMIGGVFGLLIGYLTGLQIEVTSPLSHNVSGTAKSAFQTVLATQFTSSESKNFLWWLSNVIVMGGSVAYTVVKHKELRK